MHDTHHGQDTKPSVSEVLQSNIHNEVSSFTSKGSKQADHLKFFFKLSAICHQNGQFRSYIYDIVNFPWQMNGQSETEPILPILLPFHHCFNVGFGNQYITHLALNPLAISEDPSCNALRSQKTCSTRRGYRSRRISESDFSPKCLPSHRAIVMCLSRHLHTYCSVGWPFHPVSARFYSVCISR